MTNVRDGKGSFHTGIRINTLTKATVSIIRYKSIVNSLVLFRIKNPKPNTSAMACKMIVLAVFLLAGVAYAAPSPKADAAFIAPVVAAAPVVTATSSQYIARNYNGLAAPYVAAPAAIQAVPAVATGPYITSHYTAYPAYSYASPYITYV